MTIFLISQFLGTTLAKANRLSTPNIPISHCYHWLDERSKGYLSYKYKYSSQNKGELTFYTTPQTSNGSVAGPGLYCAKTPLTSMGYGDRLIRIEFVDDVVISFQNSYKRCGPKGNFYASQQECDSKPIDVLLYSPGADWYVIKNPQAIKSWTANDDLLVADLSVSKTEGNSTAQAQIDLTLLTISAEVQKLGKKTHLNLNARASIEEILKDPKQIAKFPALSLVGMIAASSKLSDVEKRQYASQFLLVTLQDPMLTIGDFDGFMKLDSSYHEILKSKLQSLIKADQKELNTPLALAFIDKFSMAVDDVTTKRIWRRALLEKANFESVVALKIAKQSKMSQIFRQLVENEKSIVNSIADQNLVSVLNLLEQQMDTTSAPLNYWVTELFERILTEKVHTKIEEVLAGIKNPALNKETNLATVFTKALQNSFQKMDPLQVGTIADMIKDKLTAAQTNRLGEALQKLPLKVTTRLSFLLLEDYKSGRLTLPSAFDEEWFLEKLIARGIEERHLGKSTTNVYRMLMSGFYSLGLEQIMKIKEKDDPSGRDRVRMKFARTLLSIAHKIANGPNKEYAYIIYQNALLFKYNFKYQIHPLEHALEGENSQELLAFVKLAYDPSIIHFLTEYGKANPDRSNDARSLLRSYLSHLESTWNMNQLGDKDSNIEDMERKQWANLISNARYKNRAFSDACSLARAIKEFEKPIESLTSLPSRLKAHAAEVEAAYCPAPPAKPN